MKTQKLYSTPQVDVLELETEQAFATSKKQTEDFTFDNYGDL